VRAGVAVVDLHRLASAVGRPAASQYHANRHSAAPVV